MVKINQDRGICILAPKRYGKTTLLKSLCKELSTKYDVIIYNTNYESWDDIKNPHLAPFEPDAKKVHSIAYLSTIIQKIRANMNNFVLVIVDLDAFFESEGATTLKANELRDLYGTGGHQRIMAVIEAKAPKYIPPKVIDNNNLFYIGQFKDLDNNDRLHNYATRQELGSLKRHQFIEVDNWDNTRKIVEVVNGEIVTIRDLPPLLIDEKNTQIIQESDMNETMQSESGQTEPV